MKRGDFIKWYDLFLNHFTGEADKAWRYGVIVAINKTLKIPVQGKEEKVEYFTVIDISGERAIVGEWNDPEVLVPAEETNKEQPED